MVGSNYTQVLRSMLQRKIIKGNCIHIIYYIKYYIGIQKNKLCPIYEQVIINYYNIIFKRKKPYAEFNNIMLLMLLYTILLLLYVLYIYDMSCNNYVGT